MTDIPKISIILPVYNAGEHLWKCMDTLINQTLNEIEIIVILDCPTDGSDKIIKDYASKDDRIIVLENEANLNVGLSRNKGLEFAHGEYIGFSDHDDWRELNMYEELYKKASQCNSDIVISQPTMFYTDKIVEKWELPQTDRNFIKNHLLSDLIGWGNYGTNEYPTYCFIHNNLYKAELIRNNSIQFVDTKLCSPEDVLFNINAVFYANKISIVPQSLYYHREHEHSEGHGYSYRSWEKRIQGITLTYNFLNEKQIYEQFKPQFYIYVTKVTLNVLLLIVTNKKNPIEFIKVIQKLRPHKFIKEAFTHYTPSNIHRGYFKNTFRKLLSYCLK